MVVVAGLAGSTGGCAFSYQLDSLFGKDEDKLEQTGMVQTAAVKPGAGPDMAEGDLAIARAAAAEVLSRGGKDASQPWENSETGARGAATPLASAYTSDGLTCRDFLISYVRGSSEAWLQGDACRSESSGWEIRSLRAWKKS